MQSFAERKPEQTERIADQMKLDSTDANIAPPISARDLPRSNL
jgi:hypothetical protein